MTTSGRTARLLAKYRPACPILPVSKDDRSARQVRVRVTCAANRMHTRQHSVAEPVQLHLSRGCYPLFYPGIGEHHDQSATIVERINYGTLALSSQLALLFLVAVVGVYSDESREGAELVQDGRLRGHRLLEPEEFPLCRHHSFDDGTIVRLASKHASVHDGARALSVHFFWVFLWVIAPRLCRVSCFCRLRAAL